MLHLPQLAIESRLPNWLKDDGVVVQEKKRVVAVSPAAQAAGIHIGMRLGGVQMLLPEALILASDVEKETASLQAAAVALMRFSPQVCLLEHASVLVNVGASLRLFGGIRQLLRLVMQTMASLGFSTTLGCANSAKGAWLLAQAAARTGKRRGFALQLSSLTRRLDALPIALLPSAQIWLEWLHGIGCKTLGAVRQLPRAGVQRRCGKALLHELDSAYGQTHELYNWMQLSPQFRARIDLLDRIEHTEAILYFAQSMITQLCGWLTHQHLSITQIQLHLEHERGRQAIPPTPLDITLAQATWREEHLCRLLKERLAQLQLDAPVIALQLFAAQTQAMQVPSGDLFPEMGGSTEEQHRLVELLSARLGSDNVLQAAAQTDYRPEVANQWTPAIQTSKTSKTSKTSQANSKQTKFQSKEYFNEHQKHVQNRPSWLLPKAIPLELRQHRPYYRGALKLMSSAERIEAGWWDGQLVTRDYFIAESAEHLRYWIYRERRGASHQAQALESGTQDHAPIWFLHGVFG